MVRTQMNCAELADRLALSLGAEVRELPDRFLNSFDYTTTGNNLSHPVVWGLIAQAVRGLPGVAYCGIDVRLNLGRGVKFQPDLVGFDRGLNPLVFVDYESPNSSDARLLEKDVDPYIAWRKRSGLEVPYLIVTTLPTEGCECWELRYTSPGCYNADFRGRWEEVAKSPFEFWYQHYRTEFASRDIEGIALVNVAGRLVARVFPE